MRARSSRVVVGVALCGAVVGCSVDVGGQDDDAWETGADPADDPGKERQPTRPATPLQPATDLEDRAHTPSVVLRFEQDVGGPSAGLRFVDLSAGDASPPLASVAGLLSLSAARGQVDVFSSGDEGWTWHGSHFAGGRPAALELGQIGGRTFVAVQTEAHAMMVLFANADDPRRLDFPVRAFRDGAGLRAFVVGDVDADADDDLVVAHRNRLTLLPGLAALEGADPEHLPNLDEIRLVRDAEADDLAIWHDGEASWLVVTEAGATALSAYRLPLEEGAEPLAIPLPAAVDALEVAGATLFAVAEAGTVFSVTAEGNGWSSLEVEAHGVLGAEGGSVQWSEPGGALRVVEHGGASAFDIDVPWARLAWTGPPVHRVAAAQGETIAIYDVLHAPW